MIPKPIVPGVWEISLGFVNVFLLNTGRGLALIDTGVAGSAPAILEGVRALGKSPEEIRHVLVTHCHPDHAGSLAELKRLTGAAATMHSVDAELVRRGESIRPMTPAPGLVNALICRFMLPSVDPAIEAAEIEHEVEDGETLPMGLTAIHVPGHCAGQLAFLWPEQGGVLFAADAAANAFGLSLSPLYEDVKEGRRSLAKLADRSFEAACFGHGRVIGSGASARFRRRWPAVAGLKSAVERA